MNNGIEKLEKLIERTPTGELRNELTEINILLHANGQKNSERHLRLKNIAKELANMSEMPYAWEDIYYRLLKGHQLPFEIKL